MSDQPWYEAPLLGFDLETTGTDTSTDRPVSFCFVRSDDPNRRVASQLVNPGIPIPEEATAIHGITNTDVYNEGMPLTDALDFIVRTLVSMDNKGIPVVGMNVSFDLKIIDSLCKTIYGESLRHYSGWNGYVLDVMVIDRFYDKYRKGSRNLKTLCEHYGVTVAGDLHDAKTDVLATLGVLHKQIEKYPRIKNMSLSDLYNGQIRWHGDWAEHYNEYRLSHGQTALDSDTFFWPLRDSVMDYVAPQAPKKMFVGISSGSVSK